MTLSERLREAITDINPMTEDFQKSMGVIITTVEAIRSSIDNPLLVVGYSVGRGLESMPFTIYIQTKDGRTYDQILCASIPLSGLPVTLDLYSKPVPCATHQEFEDVIVQHFTDPCVKNRLATYHRRYWSTPQ